MWDGFIIGLAVTRLPCRAPSSVWRINLLSFFPPPALHTSRLRISYSSPNSVSCHREWLCNLMKWGKRAKKKEKKGKLYLVHLGLGFEWKRRWWCSCCWVRHGGSGFRFTQTHPLTPSHAQVDHSIALSAAEWLRCGGAVGSVLSSRALQKLLLRKRGILHAWLVQIRDKAQTLLLRPVFHLQEVKSKTLCKITHPTQTCLCFHVSVSCFYSSVIFNPRVVFWPRIIRVILFQSGERIKKIAKQRVTYI